MKLHFKFLNTLTLKNAIALFYHLCSLLEQTHHAFIQIIHPTIRVQQLALIMYITFIYNIGIQVKSNIFWYLVQKQMLVVSLINYLFTITYF